MFQVRSLRVPLYQLLLPRRFLKPVQDPLHRMFTKSAAYAIPLPPPFNRPTERTAEVNQYVIQLTIPSSSDDSGNSINSDLRKQGRANGSVIIWAGVGRVKPASRTNSSDAMNEYERALAEELGDTPTQVEPTFEGSRKLGQDFACAIPTTLVRPFPSLK